MPRIRFYLIGLVALAALLMVGCAGGGTSGKRVSQASDSLNTEERMPSDTLYTEERAMAIFDSLPERALQILDSAEAVGNLPDYRAGLFRAKVLSSSTAMQQQDSAIIICEALLRHDEAHRNVDFRQDVLELLVNASRMRDDYEEMIRWGTELAGLLREQNLDTEALRTDADDGDATGQEDEQPEENESGRGFESESQEKDESVKEAEEEKPEAEASEEEPSSELFHSPLPNRRATKAEAAEEQLYQQVTAAIVEEQLFLKPGFGRANIVERFGISAHRAGMIFSKHQTSIPEFVRNCRLDYACQQMKDDPLTNLSDIAAASGFNYVSSFMRDFKDRYGVTPARFRETQQAKVDDDEKMPYRNNDINK